MQHRRQPPRRGAAAVALIVVLVLGNLVLLGMIMSGGRDGTLTNRRLDTVRAFYACEAGANMAVRELMQNTDEDGDGTIGTISDDANDNTDPTIGLARFAVASSTGGGQTTLTSRGRAGEGRRQAQLVLE